MSKSTCLILSAGDWWLKTMSLAGACTQADNTAYIAFANIKLHYFLLFIGFYSHAGINTLYIQCFSIDLVRMQLNELQGLHDVS